MTHNMDYENDLEKKIQKIDKIFPINSILHQNIDKNLIKKYYKDSSLAYKLFHSKDGAVHMSLNYDGNFNKDGYKRQLFEISEIVKNKESSKILELGCGKGFNSRTLFDYIPNLTITGLDFSEKHLSIANQKKKSKYNINYIQGDFHNLPFNNENFDFLYELESICHAQNHETVLKEAYRVLKKDGKFILFEGFRSGDFENLENNIKKATILIEKSMAVEKFISIDEWLLIAEKVGFKIEENTDISFAIIPTIERLNKFARGFYKYRLLSKFFKLILSYQMIKNSIAGLLMPICVKNKALVYHKIVLKK